LKLEIKPDYKMPDCKRQTFRYSFLIRL